MKKWPKRNRLCSRLIPVCFGVTEVLVWLFHTVLLPLFDKHFFSMLPIILLLLLLRHLHLILVQMDTLGFFFFIWLPRTAATWPFLAIQKSFLLLLHLPFPAPPHFTIIIFEASSREETFWFFLATLKIKKIYLLNSNYKTNFTTLPCFFCNRRLTFWDTKNVALVSPGGRSQ